MRSVTLQDWITVQAYAAASSGPPVSAFNQPQPGWLDVSSFADATFWIDVAQVNPTTTGTVQLVLQSSPTLDEAYFAAVAPPISISASPVPLVVRTIRTPTTAPLARFLRWRLLTTNTSVGNWGATFRIRVAASPERFFQPTDLNGCVLWLRSDLGISPPPSPGSTVTGWADQSGNGNSASASGTYEPPYVQSAINGLPAIQGNGSSYMMTQSFTLGSQASLFAVHQPTLATQSSYTRLIDHQYSVSYYLGTDTTGTEYQIIVNDPNYPYGNVVGGSVGVGTTTVTAGIYDGATGTLYVNGTNVASGSLPTPSLVNSTAAVMRDQGQQYATYYQGYFAEAIVYNRALSARELTQVNRYLGIRYAVTSMS